MTLRGTQKRETAPARPCAQCGTPFSPKNAAHLYCSRACNDARQLERRRAVDPNEIARQAEHARAEEAERERQGRLKAAQVRFAEALHEKDEPRETRRLRTPEGSVLGSPCGSRRCVEGCRLGRCGL